MNTDNIILQLESDNIDDIIQALDTFTEQTVLVTFKSLMALKKHEEYRQFIAERIYKLMQMPHIEIERVKEIVPGADSNFISVK